MAREAPIIRLYLGEPELLQQLVRARSTPQGIALRARILLRCAQPDKPTNQQVAEEFGCDADTVSRWRRRFQKQRLAGLRDLPRSGRPAAFSP
jgi:transposase-like protein